MEQRISLITPGVADMAAAAGFYQALGRAQVESPDGGAFDLIGQTLGLYPKAALAGDLGLDAADIGGFFSGMRWGITCNQGRSCAASGACCHSWRAGCETGAGCILGRASRLFRRY